MVSNRSRGRVLAVAIAVVLASLLAPGVLAQEAGQSEGEPNDSPLNATLIQPGASVSGEITASENASQADADWFALPVQEGRNVTVSFESGNNSERLLVFLASPNGTENVSSVDDTLADAIIAPSGSTVQLGATANESRLYFIGVTGLSGTYSFTVETGGAMAMEENGTSMTNMTGMGNITGMGNATNITDMANATTTTTGAAATDTTTTETTTATATTATGTTDAASTETGNAGGENGGGGGTGGEGTSTTGPGFGLLAALIALLAAALLVARRR
jgi:PGF-CTERM protein